MISFHLHVAAFFLFSFFVCACVRDLKEKQNCY